MGILRPNRTDPGPVNMDATNKLIRSLQDRTAELERENEGLFEANQSLRVENTQLKDKIESLNRTLHDAYDAFRNRDTSDSTDPDTTQEKGRLSPGQNPRLIDLELQKMRSEKQKLLSANQALAETVRAQKIKIEALKAERFRPGAPHLKKDQQRKIWDMTFCEERWSIAGIRKHAQCSRTSVRNYQTYFRQQRSLGRNFEQAYRP